MKKSFSIEINGNFLFKDKKLYFLMKSFYKDLFIYLFLFVCLFIGREGERQGKKHQCVAASCMPLTGDLACMCPDWESNEQPFALQTGTQSTKPHQPGRDQ